MTTVTVSSQILITQVGAVARACLTPGQQGGVLAVFSKAIYLLTKRNDLFWIAAESAPMHQRCAAVSPPLPSPRAGSSFRMEERFLILDSGFIFELENAALWHAPFIDSQDASDSSRLAARIYSFFSNLDLSQTRGFGAFIPLILSRTQNDSTNLSQRSADPILLLAEPIVSRLIGACLVRNNFLILENMNALLGFGAGLTPSGDDFIGGLLFALHVFRQAYHLQNWIHVPIETYFAKTNLISWTLLCDLARGHAIAPLHQIANRLLGGDPFESIYPFISQLTSVGNSTGWDLLAGLLTGFLITSPQPDQCMEI